MLISFFWCCWTKKRKSFPSFFFSKFIFTGALGWNATWGESLDKIMDWGLPALVSVTYYATGQMLYLNLYSYTLERVWNMRASVELCKLTFLFFLPWEWGFLSVTDLWVLYPAEEHCLWSLHFPQRTKCTQRDDLRKEVKDWKWVMKW